jgi:hypothetical protein
MIENLHRNTAMRAIMIKQMLTHGRHNEDHDGYLAIRFRTVNEVPTVAGRFLNSVVRGF